MKSLVRIFAVCVCVALLLTGIALLLPGRALADNNARDYIPAPAGTLAILTYYEHISAQDFYVRGSTGAGRTGGLGIGGTTSLGFTANVGILRPIYFLDIPTPWGPLRAAPQVLVPFGETSLNGGLSASGMANPILLSQFWLMHNDKTKTYLAFSPFVFFNIGQYNANKQILPGAVNLGTNRWQFRQELNATKGFQVIPGHFAYFETTLGVDEFTDNTDVSLFARKQTLSQRPVLNVESHLSYDLTKVVFAAVDFYGHYGGNFSISGNGGPTRNVGALGESAIGGTLAYSFAPGFQIMAQYRGDVAVANGPGANIFLLRFLWATDLNSLMGNPQAKN